MLRLMANWLLFSRCLLVLLLHPPPALYTVTSSEIAPLGLRHPIGLLRGRGDSPHGSTERALKETYHCGTKLKVPWAPILHRVRPTLQKWSSLFVAQVVLALLRQRDNGPAP